MELTNNILERDFGSVPGSHVSVEAGGHFCRLITEQQFRPPQSLMFGTFHCLSEERLHILSSSCFWKEILIVNAHGTVQR